MGAAPEEVGVGIGGGALVVPDGEEGGVEVASLAEWKVALSWPV